MRKAFFDWISNNKDFVTTVSAFATCVLGVATLIVSIVSVVFLCRQTKINEKLSRLQVAIEQPFFRISTRLERDSDDGAYGTEHLFVENKGFHNVTSKISRTVLFKLTKNHMGNSDSVYIKVGDYFNLTESTENDDVVYHSLGMGNNRVFFNLYMEALKDRDEDGTFYWLEKVILVQIDYTDVLKDNRSVYFVDKEEVDRNAYEEIMSRVHDGVFCLNHLDYQEIKALLPG